MHLLFLTQFYPPEIGAAAVRLSRLARLLVADGHQVTVLTSLPNYPSGIIPPAYRGTLFRREQVDGVEVVRVWAYASPSKRARARLLNQGTFMALAALRGMALARPDLIFVESHPLFVTLAGGWLKRLLRAPVVLNVSDPWPEAAVATGALDESSLLVRVGRHVECWAYRDSARIVALSHGFRDSIVQAGAAADRVQVIRNGVDHTRFRPASEEQRRVARERFHLDGRPVAAHIGNLSLTYDLDTLLEAAACLPHVQFVFAGGGSQAEMLRERACDLENVRLLGVLPHEDMPEVWAAADISLIAMGDHSLADGTLPAKLYEALATGTPVVAAIRGEGQQLLAETGGGISTAIGDHSAFAEALRTLLGDADRRQAMAAAGRAYAEAHLSPQHVKDAYLALFQQAARLPQS
jgi:glycosyltransferase involved in cell wall biosynthesis